LSEFTGGWIIGNFTPTLHHNGEFEVSIKRFKKGQSEPSHKQLTATEISVVIEGQVRLANEILVSNQIGVIEPQEFASFEALEDSIIVCIKFPSLPTDKVLKI
jgi:hypothetical protein